MRPIDTAAPAVKPEPLTPAPEPLLRDATGRADIPAIANAVTQRAATDPAGARAQFDAAQSALNPVEQGELARAVPLDAWGAFDFPIPLPPIPIPGLPGSGGSPFPFPIPGLPGSGGPSFPFPSLPFPSLPGLPGGGGLPFPLPFPGLPTFPGLPGLPNPIDLGKELLNDLKGLVETLSKLPHAIADKLADSMRGDKARDLTPSERAAIKEAYGDKVDLDKVKIVDGPGDSPIAKAAFEYGGNPAITVGNTIYIRHDRYAGDLTQTGKTETLLHEFTHVVQYKELGYGSFVAKYAADLAKYHGDRNEVYRYDKRDTTYAEETIEGQAQMVGDYARYRNSTDPAERAKADDIAKRLKGTGIYGL